MSGISIREFARRDGCNDKLVRRALERGHLKAGDDGRLDPALVGTGWRKQNAEKAAMAADSARRDRRPPAQVSAHADKPAPQGEPFVDENGELISKAEAERRKEVALAELREMEVDRERQRVAPVDEIAAMVVAEYARVRTRLIGLPAKVASRAAVMKSAAEIQAMIAEEITEAMRELSLDAGGGSPADASGTIRARAFPVRGSAERSATRSA